MKMKLARAVTRVFVLFGLLGVMTINAAAEGGGQVPYPQSGSLQTAQQ